jgi:hypothetical protein
VATGDINLVDARDTVGVRALISSIAASRACSSFGVTPEGARHDYIITSEQCSKFPALLKLDAKIQLRQFTGKSKIDIITYTRQSRRF